ncbi:MAG: hypothetical protein RIB30_12090 [Thalassospira sp.]|uniref:hypothetical protein n=1 Tax=Thalassospira sp. TaxID=1912094 RepID=UPI0032EDAB4C
MTTIPRVLVIGYCYPPTASPEAFVTAKLLRNIPDCQIDVVTLEDGLVSNFSDEEMGDYAAGINGEVFKVSPSSLVKRLCRQPRLPLRPDRWLLANHSVRKKAMELMSRNYDCLVTRSQYHSAHLVGLQLKKAFPSLPWIACFSDPWSESDHQPHVPLFSSFSRHQEQKVLKQADYLVFPTEGLRKHVTNSDSNTLRKSSVIPHCYDPQLYDETPKPLDSARQELRWRIFGSFYGNRQPDILLKALDKIKVPEDITVYIEIFGAQHDMYNELDHFNLIHSDRKIIYKGQKSHKSALHLMQDSDLLIVIDSTEQQESFYLPSKIIDYIGSGAPILSICRPGTVQSITLAWGGHLANIDSIQSICMAMEDILGTPSRKNIRSNTLEFESSAIGCKFKELITCATKK